MSDREQVTLALPRDTLDFLSLSRTVHLTVCGDRDQVQLLAQRGSTKIQPLVKRGWELPEDPSPQDAPPSQASPRGKSEQPVSTPFSVKIGSLLMMMLA